MMFVGRPISDIQATDLNQEVLLGLFQDAFCERSRAELRKERQDVKTDHWFSLYLSIAFAPNLRGISMRDIWSLDISNLWPKVA